MQRPETEAGGVYQRTGGSAAMRRPDSASVGGRPQRTRERGGGAPLRGASPARPGRADAGASGCAAGPGGALAGITGGATGLGSPNFRKLQGLSDLSDPQSVDAFLSKMSQELIILSEKPSVIFKNTTMDRTASMKQALAMLESTATDLKDMERRATNHVNFLKEEIAAEERRFMATLDRVQGGLDTAALDYQTIDASMSQLIASASTIGERLGMAHRMNRLAQSTQDLLQHLWDFSQLPASSLAGSSLAPMAAHVSPVFTEDARLAEAATWVQRMLPLAADLHESNLRLGLAGPELDHAVPGSIEAALRNLRRYREHLVFHLVQRFMAASKPPFGKTERTAYNLDQMRECAAILASFDAEDTAVKGYVAMLPVFSEPGIPQHLLRLGQSEQDMRSRIAMLSQLFEELLMIIRTELGVFKRVFTHWQDAFQKLVTRVLEEKLDDTLSHAIKMPPTPSDPHAERRLLQAYLTMLLEVLEKLLAFCAAIERVVPLEAHVKSSMDTIISNCLHQYQLTEQAWLALCHRLLNLEGAAELKTSGEGNLASRLMGKAMVKAGNLVPGNLVPNNLVQGSSGSQVFSATNCGSLGDGELNERDFASFIQWNTEAMDRCRRLINTPAYAQCITSFFRPAASDGAASCLLEQCARHILTGVGVAASRAAQGLKTPMAPISREGSMGRPPAGTVAAACEGLVSSGPRIVLRTCAQTGRLIKLLQDHFAEKVKSNLTKNPACVSECTQALNQLVRAVEQRLLTAISATLDATVGQISRILSSEQRKTDFQPPENAFQRLDEPTVPCAMVVGILNLVSADAKRYLVGSSKVSFLSELGSMVQERLLKHMLKYTFNMFGALQWKRDVASYCDSAKQFGVEKVDEAFEELLQLANVLIVPPASLLGLVEGSLHMDKAEALKYVQLREDYRSARVEGMTLQALFAAGGKR